MAVYSARRTGRFEAYGRYLLPYSMFLLEKVILKFALNSRTSICRKIHQLLGGALKSLVFLFRWSVLYLPVSGCLKLMLQLC